MKTTDYSKFKFFDTNRPIHNGLVERLKESINKIGYIEGRPILVNENFEIIDGQNRFIACKQLGIPITYSVVRNVDVEDDEIIAELNKNQAIWKLNDFIHHFAQQGIKFHSTVREFEQEHKLGISASIMLCRKSDSNNITESIRNGKDIQLNPKREACVKFILDCHKLPFYKSVKFVLAVKVLFNKGTQEHIDKLFKHHMQIALQPTSGAYCNVFANIINKHRPDDKKINF